MHHAESCLIMMIKIEAVHSVISISTRLENYFLRTIDNLLSKRIFFSFASIMIIIIFIQNMSSESDTETISWFWRHLNLKKMDLLLKRTENPNNKNNASFEIFFFRPGRRCHPIREDNIILFGKTISSYLYFQ